MHHVNCIMLFIYLFLYKTTKADHQIAIIIKCTVTLFLCFTCLLRCLVSSFLCILKTVYKILPNKHSFVLTLSTTQKLLLLYSAYQNHKWKYCNVWATFYSCKTITILMLIMFMHIISGIQNLINLIYRWWKNCIQPVLSKQSNGAIQQITRWKRTT